VNENIYISLGFRSHEMIDLRIRRESGEESSRFRTLGFTGEKSGLFR